MHSQVKTKNAPGVDRNKKAPKDQRQLEQGRGAHKQYLVQ